MVALVTIGSTMAVPWGAAQPSGKTPRLCFLAFEPGTPQSNRFGTFFRMLRTLGYSDGQTITIDYLTADGQGDRFPALAAECVRRGADVIVAATTPAAQAAKSATTSIPIIMHPLGDPVGTGLVRSLAQPGGNVTGTSFMAPTMAAKRLEVLKQAIPHLSRVLVLSYLVDPIAPAQVAEIRKAARALGVSVHVREVRTAADFAPAFEAGVRERVEGALHTTETIFIVNRTRLIELAAKHRLPIVYHGRHFVQEGGLMSYGPDFAPLAERSAIYVDRVLKGARPADLPVEQPTKFDFAINARTARALGLDIPASLLLRAEVIE